MMRYSLLVAVLGFSMVACSDDASTGTGATGPAGSLTPAF